MDITIYEFAGEMLRKPELFITVILTLGVFLVNGWTDAPNAIATCITTRSLSPVKSIVMAAVLNFLGVFIMMLINSKVAQTIYLMADFTGDSRSSLIALCAAMFAIIIWSTMAWRFGMPTSESHALIAGISGAAIALQGGLSGINSSEWIKVIYGLLFSVGAGFSLGFGISRIIQRIFRYSERRKTTPKFKKAQVAGAAAMAFMHGAQDGQKFLGVFMLGIYLSRDLGMQGEFDVPVWIVLVCSIMMALGTSIGGIRIVKTVGMDMVKLEPFQGFAADLAASIALLASSIFGFPVSTTHTKTTAIMGTGISVRFFSINWKVAKNMVYTWILTFPGCGLTGFLTAKLFLSLFAKGG
ncbi:inorganic phosphate transporter [Alkalibacter saccharofermentans]|uniref:Inorganic phosphate transporter, PiT family n=1 Tax=Alkalibacter saccharofermentans DSM 14828 TaxID=1120975 RepID=A0A1M4UPQ3_9FIRM|nr:inorganic phosphate transporter [Alkalibacter saccharofermentans]SHE58716.1 inorganic phosphate transporter, PiT family [Alkalibacter saccharofermentans DSM 14828]